MKAEAEAISLVIWVNWGNLALPGLRKIQKFVVNVAWKLKWNALRTFDLRTRKKQMGPRLVNEASRRCWRSFEGPWTSPWKGAFTSRNLRSDDKLDEEESDESESEESEASESENDEQVYESVSGDDDAEVQEIFDRVTQENTVTTGRFKFSASSEENVVKSVENDDDEEDLDEEIERSIVKKEDKGQQTNIFQRYGRFFRYFRCWKWRRNF